MTLLNVPEQYGWEAEEAAERARKAGARGDLVWVGIGMWGIVFCDDLGHAWKVYRSVGGVSRSGKHFLQDGLWREHAWFKTAATTQIAPYVARVHSLDLENLVLERDCIVGRPGGWADETPLWDLHRKISKIMERADWGGPEFKGDSYIYGEDGVPVLVDATSAFPLGKRLLQYVKDNLSGKLKSNHSYHDLAFFVVREISEKALSAKEAAPTLRKLVSLDPEIADAFTLPAGVL